MATESSVNVPNSGTTPIRDIQITTLINGVPTTVGMQVIAISDANGNILDNAARLDQIIAINSEILSTLKALALTFAAMTSSNGADTLDTPWT